MKKPVGVVGDNVRELFNTAISFFIENQINPILLNNPYLARRTTTETGPKTSINADTLQLINIHLNREITLTTPLKEKDLVKRLNNFQKYGLTELRDPEKSLVWNPANLK